MSRGESGQSDSGRTGTQPISPCDSTRDTMPQQRRHQVSSAQNYQNTNNQNKNEDDACAHYTDDPATCQDSKNRVSGPHGDSSDADIQDSSSGSEFSGTQLEQQRGHPPDFKVSSPATDTGKQQETKKSESPQNNGNNSFSDDVPESNGSNEPRDCDSGSSSESTEDSAASSHHQSDSSYDIYSDSTCSLSVISASAGSERCDTTSDSSSSPSASDDESFSSTSFSTDEEYRVDFKIIDTIMAFTRFDQGAVQSLNSIRNCLSFGFNIDYPTLFTHSDLEAYKISLAGRDDIQIPEEPSRERVCLKQIRDQYTFSKSQNFDRSVYGTECNAAVLERVMSSKGNCQ